MQSHLNKLIGKHWHIIVCMLLWSVAPPNLYGADSSVIPSPIAIVVHKATGVGNLSLDELRSIFLADQQFWSDRTRIILLVRAPQSKERDFVLNRIYQMNEAQLRKYWIAKMFRSEVPRGPKIVFSTHVFSAFESLKPDSA